MSLLPRPERPAGTSLLRIEQFTIIVDDYDKAIGFFTGAAGVGRGWDLHRARRAPCLARATVPGR